MKKLAFLALGLVALAGAAALFLQQRLATPYRGFSDPEVFVDLPTGTGVAAIADRLAAAGVVPDALTFRLAARLSGSDRKLQAGEYRFADAATPRDVVARLAAGDVYSRSVTFPEGLTIREMAVLFERAGLGTAADFVAASRTSGLVPAVDPTARSLEGYLFPDTYALPRKIGAEGAVRAMLARFDATFTADLRASAEAQQFTPREVVTLASLIEKETARPEERPVVAAVYRNRLKIGMLLQCDPTVIYALMLANRWNGNIRRDDLQINSPYNTYRFAGLPPGPIASPGRASIEAALAPADVPYLYFVSRNDGSHVFASTLAEHNRNVAKYQRGR
ncbi:MAG TPA: endolytic transglycosylase MltG [Vicinamibacterales bacterium]|nr:endolytic transglycosylase MltG [Vicinamibacterales bacterium]